MSSESLPTEITVRERPDGQLLYVFPQRELGVWRWVGLVPILFGLCFAGFAVSWVAVAVGIGGLAFAAFGLPFVVAGLGSVGVGLFILAGHSEVELNGAVLRAIERAGPMRYARKRTTSQIKRLVVSERAGQETHSDSARQGLFQDLAAIVVDCGKDKRMLLAPGYPRRWLLPLAQELARRCDLATEELGMVRIRQPIEVVEEKPTGEIVSTEESDRLVQPDNSDIEMEKAADGGVTFEVPPAGLWRGSHGLFFFSLLWNGFMAVFTSVALFAKMWQQKDAWIVLLFLLGFWAVGLSFLLATVNMGRRRAVLAVVGDELLALQTSILGARKQRWHRDKLIDICPGPSNMTVNEAPVLELQVHSQGAPKFGILSGRSTKELHWLAASLRQALRLARRPPEDAYRHQDEQPETSDVLVEKQGDGVTLTLPPAGIVRATKGMIWIGIIFTMVGGGILVIPFFDTKAVCFLVPFGLCFGSIGLALVLGAVNMGRRQAVLAVVGDQLLVMQTGIFGTRRRDWQRADLQDIAPGPSGMAVNNQPILELQFKPKNGKPFGMLAGRDHAELGWLATVLRKALKMQERGRDGKDRDEMEDSKPA